MTKVNNRASSTLKSKMRGNTLKGQEVARSKGVAHKEPVEREDISSKVAEDVHTYKLFAPDHEEGTSEVVNSLALLDISLRRYGIEGEDAFLVVAAGYLNGIRNPRLHLFPLDRAFDLFRQIARDKQLVSRISAFASVDRYGSKLSVCYQFFLGRKFREGSGKFFTPQPVARAMAKLLPLVSDAVLMDPTCGGGTFLLEASRRWKELGCRLIGNDVDRMLAGLSELVLLLATPNSHDFEVYVNNLYEPQEQLRALRGKVNGILANPPFSLAIDSLGYESELYRMGYRTSDAVFLDVCLELLAPNGTLVCLLPHSIVANAEYARLRNEVERRWELCGVVTLPEGVFYMTGNTSTRADIVHLRKRKGTSSSVTQTYFSNAPSVGVALNSRKVRSNENALEELVNDERLTVNVQYPEPEHA